MVKRLKSNVANRLCILFDVYVLNKYKKICNNSGFELLQKNIFMNATTILEELDQRHGSAQ